LLTSRRAVRSLCFLGALNKAMPVDQLEKQIMTVLDAIRKHPSRRRQILSGYASNFFEAVKETIKKQGTAAPLFIVIADPPVLGIPPLTEEVLTRAKEAGAEAILSVEGFQAYTDISDVIYHVSLSAPCIGVMGWVLKVKLGDGWVEFLRELPYYFESGEKMKTLGELIEEMER